jgi:hypothetical protein
MRISIEATAPCIHHASAALPPAGGLATGCPTLGIAQARDSLQVGDAPVCTCVYTHQHLCSAAPDRRIVNTLQPYSYSCVAGEAV